MTFWIVTPSYNQLDWLRLCIASVRDQAGAGLSVHHHVQDASSKDGTPAYLADLAAETKTGDGYSFSYASEPDNGMYDAINRGWLKASPDVDVIAHLNCDEQYLPGALKRVADDFSQRPEVDVVMADMVVVDQNGEYICHRRSVRPYAWVSRCCCAGFTATTFHRASVVREKRVLFDTSWRNFGDKVWYNALHKAGCRFKVLNQMVAVFTDTGANLNWTDEGLREKKRYEAEVLGGSATAVRLVSLLLGARRVVKEWRLRAPSEYAVYRSGAATRAVVPITHPRGTWHKRWRAADGEDASNG